MAGDRILLRGGLVADGAGATTRRADVLVEGDRIAEVRDTPEEGAHHPAAPAAHVESVPDSPGRDTAVLRLAPGSVICPGFIDAHAHAEGPLLKHGQVDGALAQGVTTLVVGQDGQSWIGATAAAVAYLNRYFGPVNGPVPISATGPLDVAGYASAVAGRLTQNVAVLASQGTIRYNVAGLAPGPLDPGQQAAARRQVEDALAQGAAGLSSGLDYLPSRYGDPAEVAELARPLAAAGRPYVSHLRGYGPKVAAGLGELTEVGRRSGARVHASHLWGAPPAIEQAFADADAAGVPLSFDAYPYRRSSTLLTMLLLPPEIQAGGPDQTVAALADPAQRARLLAGERFSAGYLAQVQLGTLPAGDAAAAGLTITEAAARAGQPPGEWTLDLLARSGLQVGAHLDRLALAEADLAWLARHDRHSAGSDGIYQGQHPHPRGYGAFARLAGYYAGGDPGPAYQALARHLATHAAAAFGLRDRGRVAPGLAADLCVIAPSGLTERATYADPTRPAAGVTLVLVNGTVTWKDGAPVPGAAPGRMIS
ncbi:MAG TPA: amidohydrolase family protein [Streptosporangiaceae bacterium]|nr:amidohydrolase family protein [Streptosporangiaceae bacterium]